MIRTRLVAVALVLEAALFGAGCAGGPPARPAPVAIPAAPASQQLSGMCPATVVVQTQWEPQAEHGAVYELLGPGYTVDADHKRVGGPLVAGGRDTGVRLEIRAGGAAIGFVAVPAQMYLDRSITLGMVETDLAVATSATQPVTAVVAPMTKSPQMLMWDPASHPDWRGIADMKDSGARVVVSKDREYPGWLVAKGLLTAAQVDRGYTGNPARFVSDPSIAQQGYATAEPYVYEHKVRGWGKPVRYQLLADVGYRTYPQALSVRADDIPRLAGCLSKLVPLVQQAQIDYLAVPRRVNDLLVGLVSQYRDGWDYTAGDADFAVDAMRRLGVVGNDTSGEIGSMDPARIQGTIDAIGPVLAREGKPIRPGLSVSSVATNRFINPAIRAR